QQMEIALLRPTNNQPTAEARIGVLQGIAPNVNGPVIVGFRMLVAESNSTRPFKFFVEDAEVVKKAFDKTWGSRAGRANLVEAALTATVQFDGPRGAQAFMKKQLGGTSGLMESHLGRDFEHLQIKWDSGMLIAQGTAA